VNDVTAFTNTEFIIRIGGPLGALIEASTLRVSLRSCSIGISISQIESPRILFTSVILSKAQGVDKMFYLNSARLDVECTSVLYIVRPKYGISSSVFSLHYHSF
jgi:hypothetical protein